MAKRKKEFKPVEIANDVYRLRDQLSALKNKEARLEADLAIKELPELEEGLIQLVLAVTDVSRAEEFRKIAGGGQSAIARSSEMLLSQLDGYGAKLAALDGDDSPKADLQRQRLKNRMASVSAMLDESGEDVGRFRVLNENVSEAINVLRRVYAEWSERFESAGVNLQLILPKVVQYVDGSGD